MSTDLVTYHDTDLTLADDQHAFSDAQRAALAHMGVSDAPEGDLQIFFHQCRRTELDPFLRQIYMIGRESSVNVNGQWVKETKYTIQTGIDGFRVIGHRAAAQSRHTVSISAPDWAHPDGTWRPVWSKAWGRPVAARVTIERNGHPFTAVALFDEYAQSKRNGDLTKMWEQRPGGQIAKCAEALAWRMAFPHDLSGVYIDEELQHADNEAAPVTATVKSPGLAGLRAAVEHTVPADVEPVTPPPGEDIEDAVEVPETGEALTTKTRGHLFALFNELGWDRAQQLAWLSEGLKRTVESRSTLTEREAVDAIGALKGMRPDGAA